MTVNTESLLDKLYNLRGSESTILREMDREKAKAEETKDRTTEEKAKLQANISELKKQREELEVQGEKFKDILKNIHREDYETVLARLNIDFDPKALLDKIENNLPKTIEMVEKDAKKSEDELVKVEDEMNTAITTIEELAIRKDTALTNQEKLNEYFELALAGNINITRDSITSLLQEFGFNEEEQRETAKILMFPEDGLFEYDQKMQAKCKVGKSISEVIQEAKEMIEEPELNLETSVLEPVLFDTAIEPIVEPVVEEEPINQVFEEIIQPEVVEEKEDDLKSLVIETLKNEGIDYLDFTSEEVLALIHNFDQDVVVKNIQYMNSKGLDNDIFVNHIAMMYDKELEEKVELLLENGKESLDIYLNPSVLVKYNYAQLEEAINLLKTNGIEPKDIPLMAY